MLRTTLLALSLSTSFAAPYKKVADNETTWMLGGAGQNCSFACHSQAMRCTEKAWPSTQYNFQQEVLSTMPNNGGCNTIQSERADQESDPQKQGDTCWWDADPADRYRCNEIPASDHQRFCPCTPPPPTWVLGGAGQSCHKVCYSKAMRCTEKVWPATQYEFQQEVLNTMPNNGGCNEIKNVGDDMESDPQKQGDTCWWDADPADKYRCNEIPSSDHQRFCPCTPPPPPPAHCPPAEAACAADQNCNAFGVFNNNYQLHGCSDALLPNGDWTVYVLSNTSGWQPIAGHVNVDESQCKVHPTGKITGTCSTAAPPPPPPPTPPPPPANCQQVLLKYCGGTHKQCIKCATHTHAKETAAAHCSPLDMQTFCTRCNGNAC